MLKKTILTCLIVFSQYSYSENAECSNIRDAVEKVICQDGELNSLYNEFNRLYSTALGKLTGEWKDELKTKNLKWAEYRNIKALKYINAGDISEEGKKHLKDDIEFDIRKINDELDLGKTKYISNNKNDIEICSETLDIKNIEWKLVRNYQNTNDEYHLLIPKTYDVPEWKVIRDGISYTDIDLLNSGVSSRIYKIDFYRVPDNTYAVYYSWLVVADSNEIKDIEKELSENSGNEVGYYNFSKKLTVKNKYGFNPPAFSESKREAGNGILKSILVDGGSSEVFGGFASTKSQVFIYNKVAYIATESSGLYGQSKLVIYKAIPSGEINPICYHKALPSADRRYVVEDSSEECRDITTAQSLFTQMNSDDCKIRTQKISIKEWGGERPVKSECYSEYRNEMSTKLSVGSIGKDAYIDEERWGPMSKIEYGSLDLVSNKNGEYVKVYNSYPYHEEDPPRGIQYYRIKNNDLEPVCTIKFKRVPPPGYPGQEEKE